MGVSAAWAVAAIAAAGVAQQADSSRYASNTARDEAKRQRDLLASLKDQPVPEMPTPDSAQARLEKRRSIASQLSRRGRASTMLTGNKDPLGGGA